MSEELERSLSRFRMYELSLPMTDSLEHALSHVYSETIVFCEHTVALFLAVDLTYLGSGILGLDLVLISRQQSPIFTSIRGWRTKLLT